jgi:hypothetical protein
MAMDCASEAVAHTVAHSMDDILAVVLGQGSSLGLHKAYTVVVMVAVEPVFPVAHS